jgi:hypothetical protein
VITAVRSDHLVERGYYKYFINKSGNNNSTLKEEKNQEEI